MTIAIWGAGAVGLGLASALARSEDRLKVLVRNAETQAALEMEGITRTGLFGSLHVPNEQLEITDDPDRLAQEPPDWLLICTKACATQEIARSLESRAKPMTATTKILLCQNGWGNEAPFLDFWPEKSLFHARIITGFHRRTASRVEITAHASPIALGSLFGTALDSLEELAERLCRGGIPAETTDDMRGVLWAKMLYNCALNPLGALAGRRYGELVEDSTTRVLLEEVIREIFNVLAAAGIELAWPNADAYLDTFHTQLIPPTAAHESSMLQDLRGGRPTEIEALCGAVEALGAANGIPTPVTSSLATLVRTVERSAAKQEPR